MQVSTYHACGKEYSWFNIVQRDVAWDLAYRVADREYGVDLIELVPAEFQLLLHPGDIGIVQVGSIYSMLGSYDCVEDQDVIYRDSSGSTSNNKMSG